MRADIMEKEKGSLPVVKEKPAVSVVTMAEAPPEMIEKAQLADLEKKYDALCRQLEASFALKEKKLVEEMQSRHTAECRRMQEVGAAREKALLTEVDVKYDMIFKQLEESFAQKEKKLIADLEAGHAAECRNLQQDTHDREQVLLERLSASRRQLLAVIIVAGFSIAGILNFKARHKDVLGPVVVYPTVPARAAVPALSAEPSPVPAAEAVLIAPAAVAPAPAAAVPTPVLKDETAPAPVKAGNGGNFASGRSGAKK